jgi:hypothetical protein
MRRVLKPSGRLHFVEHGLSREPRKAHWQHGLTPCCGCHLDRKADDLNRIVGFGIGAIETGYITGPKPWTFQGLATQL